MPRARRIGRDPFLHAVSATDPAIGEDRLPSRIGGLGRWAWLVLCFVMPISGRLVPVPLVAAVALLLAQGLWSGRSMRWSLPWPLAAFYALHVLGMAWTADWQFGLFDLQIKLGLILLPLAAGVLGAGRPGALRESMIAFSAGLAVAIGLSSWKAAACYAASGNAACFTQSALSFELHPSYAAWYASWAILYWGHELIAGRVRQPWLRSAALAHLPILLAFAFMLGSRSGAVALAAVALILLTQAVLTLRSAMRWAILGAAALAMGGGLVIGGGTLAERASSAVAAVRLARSGDAAIYASEGGSEMRMVAWICSTECLQGAPFGAGTGDIKEALVACYASKKAVPAMERRLNSHSQFLQGGVALGWPGLLLALLIPLVPLAQGFRRRSLLLAGFALLLLTGAAVESVLEVQAGVALVGAFLGLLSLKGHSVPSEGGGRA